MRVYLETFAQTAAVTTATGLSVLALAGQASADTAIVDQYIGGDCVAPSSCGPAEVLQFTTNERMTVNVTFTADRYTCVTLAWNLDGQPGPPPGVPAAAGHSTEFTRTLEPDKHTIAVQAMSVGGCEVGGREDTWGGTLRIYRIADNAPPPDKPLLATVFADVDVYNAKNEPEGAGQVVGMLRAGQQVELVGGCEKMSWCQVAGPNVPGGTGWVWGHLS